MTFVDEAGSEGKTGTAAVRLRQPFFIEQWQVVVGWASGQSVQIDGHGADGCFAAETPQRQLGATQPADAGAA